MSMVVKSSIYPVSQGGCLCLSVLTSPAHEEKNVCKAEVCAKPFSIQRGYRRAGNEPFRKTQSDGTKGNGLKQRDQV